MKGKVIMFFTILFVFAGALAVFHFLHYQSFTGMAVYNQNPVVIASGENSDFRVRVFGYSVAGNIIKINYGIQDLSGIPREINVELKAIQAEKSIGSYSDSVVLGAGDSKVFASQFYAPSGAFDAVLIFSSQGNEVQMDLGNMVISGKSITSGAIADLPYSNIKASGALFFVVLIVIIFVVMVYIAPRFYHRKRAVEKMGRGIGERHIKLNWK